LSIDDERGETAGASVARVRGALAALGLADRVVALPGSARMSAEAARQVGCHVDQIAKSLVFKGRRSQRALLVVACGGKRVDERKIAAVVAEPIEKADAEFVRARTGFAIGGVAPVGHLAPLTTLIDEDLLRWDELWAAAGHPHAVFKLSASELIRMTGGEVVAVR
jgi:prolyl-tRNA editing enzyme YbaK/EbsC (Cys-tRNA(Pro) deacylase)